MDRRNILIIVNLAIVILEIIGFALVFKELGTDAFIYYTEDSNLILLISSLVFLAYAFLKKDLPSWFKTYSSRFNHTDIHHCHNSAVMDDRLGLI